MGIDNDYHLQIHTDNGSYDVELTPVRSQSAESVVTVGGVKYSILGKDETVGWVNSKIQGLDRADFTSFEELKAALLSPNSTTEKIQNVAFRAHPHITQSTSISETSNTTELVSGKVGKEIDAYLTDLEQRFHFSGAVAVKSAGKTVLCKGYGKATRTIHNNSSTAFQIASVSKQFTAAAILKLVEQGSIDLDGKISQYLEPKYTVPSSWKDITVRQLLTHTSGLKNNFDCKKFEEAKKAANNEGIPFEPSVEELFEYIKDEPLRGENEKKPYYSNNGYYLLGMIIENRSGKSYGDYIQQDLLPPEMSSTGYYNDQRKSTLESASGCHLNENFDGLSPETETVAAEAYAAGGLYTTAQDMLIWNDALFSGKVLKDELRNEMITPQEGEYGLGIEVTELSGKQVVRQGGTLPGGGFKAEFCHFKESGDTVVLLLNNFDLPIEKIRDGVIDAIAGKAPQKILSTEDEYPDFPHDRTFADEKGKKRHLFKKVGDQYHVIYSDGKKELLVPLENGRFLNLKWGTEWKFNENRATCYDRDGSLVGTLYTE